MPKAVARVPGALCRVTAWASVSARRSAQAPGAWWSEPGWPDSIRAGGRSLHLRSRSPYRGWWWSRPVPRASAWDFRCSSPPSSHPAGEPVSRWRPRPVSAAVTPGPSVHCSRIPGLVRRRCSDRPALAWWRDPELRPARGRPPGSPRQRGPGGGAGALQRHRIRSSGVFGREACRQSGGWSALRPMQVTCRALRFDPSFEVALSSAGDVPA